jgi:hypothetical protein
MYDKLIKELRCDYELNCWKEECPYLVSSSYNYCDAKRKEHDAADAIEQLISRVPKWISVNERLPELTEQVEGDNFLTDFSKDVVVVSGKAHLIQIGRLVSEGRNEYWTDDTFDEIKSVTHWMEIPELPKGEL